MQLRRDITTAAPFSSPLLHHAHHHCCHMLITAAAPFPSSATPARTVAATDARMHIHEHGAVTVAPTAAEATGVARAEATLAAATEATPASKPECSTTKGGSIGSSRSREQAGVSTKDFGIFFQPKIFTSDFQPKFFTSRSRECQCQHDGKCGQRWLDDEDTLHRQVHSNSPPACAPTQQNASTHHGRTHHSPFPTCQPRSSVLCIARSAAAAVHSAPPPRVNHVHNKTGLRASQ